MSEREFGNFSEWPLKELIAKERSFTVGDMRGTELKAEIQRRYDARNRRYLLATLLAATSAFAQNSPAGKISKSGSGRRKGARIDGMLVGLNAVQFHKVDQHQPVGRLTIFLRLGKQGALVW
jgi:hypothetical protein